MLSLFSCLRCRVFVYFVGSRLVLISVLTASTMKAFDMRDASDSTLLTSVQTTHASVNEWLGFSVLSVATWPRKL